MTRPMIGHVGPAHRPLPRWRYVAWYLMMLAGLLFLYVALMAMILWAFT